MAEARKTAAPTPSMTDDEKAAAVAKSYTVAATRLREQYLDEFNKLRVTAAKELGVEWKPQPTKEQKAQAEIDRLLAENPALAKIYARMNATEEDPGPDPEAEGEPVADEAGAPAQ